MRKLFGLAFCVALFCAGFVRAEDIDAARAAVRGSTTSSSVVPSSRTESREQKTSTQSSTSSKSNQQTSTRSGTAPRVSSESKTRSAVPQTQSTREISSRSAVSTPVVSSRSVINSISNMSVSGRAAKISSRSAISAPVVSSRSATVARSGSTSARLTGTATSGYKACRDTFFQCMDEFCANKDAQLKRCACSARIHEFDNIKKTLNTVEDKMLDFNERLLAVNMDKEDAVAMSSATEGEKAYQQEDKSDSQSILNTIMKKLQSTSAETESTNVLSAINLSMDTNVFDTVDSELGAETVVKEGEALYSAALPTCLEMANEVCAEDEIPMVKSAYNASIEQDCNTVAKTYASLKDKTLEKVREGNALLEMSRLNNQQTRNSDDILACKKKMLEALSDSSVCGEDMSKCLDWSGKYINPATGEAILTSDLNQLANMITRPTGDDKWVRSSSNKKFVTFLETKKKYIEPAMVNCESLQDTVWNNFLEDALAQIKLAQEKKLEDMRQSCTTLTTECMNNTADSLEDFDSRALSIFGVNYDKNVNQVCAEIETAGTTLMNGEGTDAYWGAAIGNIATAKTLDQIITTCTEVGKNCIIRNCMNLESKFGLCQSETAIMRTNILNHSNTNPCWDEVSECVEDAGVSVISDIIMTTGKFGTEDTLTGNIIETFNGGATMYTRNSTNTFLGAPLGIHLWCDGGLNSESDLCRITERIWGNCTESPTTGTGTILDSNLQSESLLAWFADNTIQSCSGTACDPGWYLSNNGCALPSSLTSDISYCPASTDRFNVSGSGLVDYVDPWNYPDWSNCCDSGQKDYFGNCCSIKASVTNLNLDATAAYSGVPSIYVSPSVTEICSTSDTDNEFMVAFNVPATTTEYRAGMSFLVCVGGTITGSSAAATCSGRWVVMNKDDGTYRNPEYSTGTPPSQPNNYYSLDITTSRTCVFDFSAACWKLNDTSGSCDTANCDKVATSTALPLWPDAGDNDLFISY